LAFLRGTTTTTGLQVDAVSHDGVYPTGQGVSDVEMATLRLDRHDSSPTWNYTLRPRCSVPVGPQADEVHRELIA